MSRPTFDHLRLVTADDFSTGPIAPPPPFVADWPTLCTSFHKSTGLLLEFCEAGESPTSKQMLWDQEVPSVGDMAPGRLVLSRCATSRVSAQRIEAAERLAKVIGSLVVDLHEAHRALWHREAELATAVPVVVQPREVQNQIAKKFEAVLKSAAQSVDCHAAAMYLLDDDTRNLKLRSHWGLAHSRFAQPPRPLRGARADLEALAGHAVTLEQVTRDSEWEVPEDYAAAACVPISSATVPLGTLWVFSEQSHPFSDAEVNLLEITAGRLATELEREVLLREHGVAGSASHVHDAIRWQQEMLPPPVESLEQWQVAARPSSRTRLHGDLFHWHLDDDQQLHVTLATATTSGLPAALTAAKLSGALQRRADRGDTPEETLRQLNDVLTVSSSGGEGASGWSAILNEKNGIVDYAAAGQIDAFVVRPHGWEPVFSGGNEPLGNWPESATAELRNVTVEPGDILVVLGGQPRTGPRVMRPATMDAQFFAEAVLHHPHLKPDELATLLASLWEPGETTWNLPPAVLVAKRRG